ncbi:MAG: ADP-dependent NAD(P)H-hydrate dehydratase / NAD(P)H-hydrate epimerase [Acidobacteriota bacterium]|nr:ADP-dependent NAD(P)H-hydrate dehydratase / NAD(P)H-hydrate epimerase [Acidobacteriota bacterium]
MRELDRRTTERYALPSLLLMEAAANAAALTLSSRFPQGLFGLRVLILCGRGNNGGDGAALARALWTRGASKIEVLLFGHLADAHGDALSNFQAIKELAGGTSANDDSRRLTFDEFVEGDASSLKLESSELPHVIVDALFGTGLTRPLEGVFKEVVARIASLRESHATRDEQTPFILSLDIPSGLDADSAETIGAALKADMTVTFTAPKPANVLPPASHFNGRLIVAEIGTPSALINESPSQLFLVEAEDAHTWLRQTRYAPDSYKNTHGHALVLAGSREMSGAAVLCAAAAMRSGAGLVTVGTPHSALASVAARVMPEVMTAGLPETRDGAVSEDAFARASQLAERADVIAIGPGLTSGDESTRRFVRSVVIRRNVPVVIDADGLNSLAPWPSELRGSDELPLVLTPHIGEMRRLLGVNDEDALKDRVRAAREFATAHQLILVLKGSRTVTAAPDGRVFVNPTGNAGLGTAGAGDTLTGIITGFIAQARGAMKQRADVLSAVLSAIYVGGLAGDLAARERGMRTMVASDIREHFGAAVRALDAEGEQPSRMK